MAICYVVILLSAGLADDLGDEAPALAPAVAIRQAMADHDATLTPGETRATEDGDMVYVTLSVTVCSQAQRLADVLGAIEGVEAAYVKPAEALP